MKRFWAFLFDRPFTAGNKRFRTEAAMSRYVWKEALRD